MLIWPQAEVEVARTWLISGMDMDGRSCLVLRNNKQSLALVPRPLAEGVRERDGR